MKYFVSDFHFGANSKDKEFAVSSFEKFCDCLPSAAELYILGDFFDFWIEYRTVVPADYVEIYSILLNARKRGIQITLVRGNHDFMRGDFWKKLKIKTFDKYVRFNLGAKRFYCTHGDEIRGGKTYSITSIILRNAFFQFLYKLLPPDFAIWFAGYCSALSRKKNEGLVQTDERKERYRKRAFVYADRKRCSVLIAGHSHICDLVKFGNKIYANSGVWHELPTYVLLDEKEKKLSLKEFCGGPQKDAVLSELEF